MAANSEKTAVGLRNIPLNQLYPHPDNPRKDLGDLSELAESIKVNGIFQNLTAVPAQQVPEVWSRLMEDPDRTDPANACVVIIGHRRMAAAKLAGFETVPCAVVNMTRKEQLSTMLAENMQRSDLKPYEQAQGFQMMLDLGCTVEEISKQSGFSDTTVRKRLKMAELDQTTLKEVSERQVAISDFDRLAEIKDITARNRALENIGTRNFDQAVREEITKERRKHNLPLVRMELKKLNYPRVEERETYGPGYTTVHSFYIEDWKEGTPLVPPGKTIPEFYSLDAEYGRVGFYVKTKRAKPEKRPQEEIDREKEIHAQWNELKEKSRMAFQLRSDFVKGLKVSKGNLETVFRGAAMVIVMYANYHGTDRDGLMAMLGVDEKTRWGEERDKVTLQALREMNVSEMLPLVYAGFNDGENVNYATTYTKEMPQHKENPTLDALYDWLISLGYEPSDEETSLRDGTHSVYHAKEG